MEDKESSRIFFHFAYNGIPKGQCPFGGFGQSPISIIAKRYLFLQAEADSLHRLPAQSVDKVISAK